MFELFLISRDLLEKLAYLASGLCLCDDGRLQVQRGWSVAEDLRLEVLVLRELSVSLLYR